MELIIQRVYQNPWNGTQVWIILNPDAWEREHGLPYAVQVNHGVGWEPGAECKSLQTARREAQRLLARA